MRFSSIPFRLPLPLLATILLISPLSACGGGGGNCGNQVVIAPFKLCIGNDWEQVSGDLLRERGVPEETIAALRRKEQREGQRDNIVVSRESLPAAVPSKAYADANVKTVMLLPEYDLREKREVTINGDETFLHIFTARPAPELPARRFYQLSLTIGFMGFTFTGTLPFSPAAEIEEELIGILESVRGE